MYTGSVVDVATTFCTRERHEVAERPSSKMYPEKDRLVSMQVA